MQNSRLEILVECVGKFQIFIVFKSHYLNRLIFIVLIDSLYRFLSPQTLADCATILFGITGTKKHIFLNEYRHGTVKISGFTSWLDTFNVIVRYSLSQFKSRGYYILLFSQYHTSVIVKSFRDARSKLISTAEVRNKLP